MGVVLAKIQEGKLRFSFWRKPLLILVVAAMVMVAGVMVAAYLAQRRLGAEIIRISRAGEPASFTDLRPNRTQPAGEDAGGCYVEVLRQIHPAELARLIQVNVFYRMNLVSMPTSQFPNDMRDKVRQILTNARPILARIDEGAGLELSNFDIGITRGNQVCKARLDSVQGIAFLLSLRTLDSILRRDSNEATESIVSTLKLMRVFDVHPTMLVEGRKMLCVRLVCSDIQFLLMYCRPSQDQLKKLQSLLEETFQSDAMEKTFLAERVYQLEIARNVIPEDVVKKYLTAGAPNMPERLVVPGLSWHRMQVFDGSLRYLREMAWLITVARQPWPEPLDEITDANKSPSGRPSQIISSVIPFSRLTADTLAMVQCTTAAVAIERYRGQKGSIPGSLDDILPLYIESIPLDPFTGKPLLYNADVQSYTIYSTGANRADDGGAVVPGPNEPAMLDTGIRIKRVAAR